MFDNFPASSTEYTENWAIFLEQTLYFSREE